MTVKDNKKAHISDALVGDEIQALQSANADQHRDRITRFEILKHRAKQQENFLWTLAKFKENYPKDAPSDESARAIKSAQKLKECGNFLLFKNFYTIDQVKLSKFHVCNQHLLCPFCAGIRASRSHQRYTKRIDEVLSKNRKLKPVFITFTVKNGFDLAERFNHLMKSFRALLDRRRDYIKKGRGFNEFCKINGAFYSYENTYNDKEGWHPHIHMFALLDEWIDQSELSQFWESLTGDSKVVDIRRVQKEKGLGYSKGISEVCKYALKFGDLTVQNTWEAFKVLKGKRLSGAFGSLWGVKIPENLADDMPDEKDLPYLEMLYKFVFGKQSYYNLEMTRHVEPHSKDNDNEEEAGPTTDRGGIGRSDLAIEDEANALRVRGHAERERMKQGRKKQHWQVPPVTRVRVKKRIKRWDGYLCVMHM